MLKLESMVNNCDSAWTPVAPSFVAVVVSTPDGTVVSSSCPSATPMFSAVVSEAGGAGLLVTFTALETCSIAVTAGLVVCGVELDLVVDTGFASTEDFTEALDVSSVCFDVAAGDADPENEPVTCTVEVSSKAPTICTPSAPNAEDAAAHK